MRSYRLNNLFTSSSSKILMITNQDYLKPILVNMKNNDDQEMQEYAIPSGVSDVARLNKNYKELINELSISEISNQEALKKILHVWKDDELDNNYAKWIFLKNNKSASKEEKKLKEQKYENEIIYIWRTTKLSIPSIAFKLSIPSVFVFNSINKYNCIAKKIIRDKISIKNKQRSSISIEKHDKVCVFWKLTQNKVFHFKDIKRNVWSNDNNRTSWNSNIASTLKKKLKMSSKWLKVKHPKIQAPESKRLYFEGALVQYVLSSNHHEILYIDEFQVNNWK